MAHSPPIETIIFDFGGVLVELGGVEEMLGWCGGVLDEREMWARWLTSPCVRAFETGRMSVADFGVELVREFALCIEPEPCVDAFRQWPKRLSEGAAELLQSLAAKYRLASLSNSNELHWDIVCGQLGLGPLFERHFPSHLTGMIKPDREVFDHVVEQLGGGADRMLFLDDNQPNVDSALAAGLRAARVGNAREAEALLKAMGLM